MQPSKYDGKPVLHVDGAAMVHSGVVVGQSDDGETVYVKADRTTTPTRSGWDFGVASSLIPALVKNAMTHSEKATPPKHTQADADYTDHAATADHCAACKHFNEGGSCAVVSGKIEPTGWCKYWEAK